MSDDQAEVAILLGKCSLFRGVDRLDLLKLASYASRRKYRAGEPIFHAGDPGESLMGVATGEVRISRTSADGGEIIISDFGPGDVFGEIALLDGNGRSADAKAITSSELINIERRDFLPFVQDRPAVSVELLRVLCEKIRLADERSSDFLFLDLATRLAKALLRLCPSADAASRQAKTSLSQGELAKIIGATRPNVNRQLREWERNGLIAMSKGWIVVRDREQLTVAANP